MQTRGTNHAFLAYSIALVISGAFAITLMVLTEPKHARTPAQGPELKRCVMFGRPSADCYVAPMDRGMR